MLCFLSRVPREWVDYFQVFMGFGFWILFTKSTQMLLRRTYFPHQKEISKLKNLDELQMQASKRMGDDNRPKPGWLLSLLQPGHLLLHIC